MPQAESSKGSAASRTRRKVAAAQEPKPISPISSSRPAAASSASPRAPEIYGPTPRVSRTFSAANIRKQKHPLDSLASSSPSNGPELDANDIQSSRLANQPQPKDKTQIQSNAPKRGKRRKGIREEEDENSESNAHVPFQESEDDEALFIPPAKRRAARQRRPQNNGKEPAVHPSSSRIEVKEEEDREAEDAIQAEVNRLRALFHRVDATVIQISDSPMQSPLVSPPQSEKKSAKAIKREIVSRKKLFASASVSASASSASGIIPAANLGPLSARQSLFASSNVPTQAQLQKQPKRSALRSKDAASAANDAPPAAPSLQQFEEEIRRTQPLVWESYSEYLDSMIVLSSIPMNLREFISMKETIAREAAEEEAMMMEAAAR